VKNQLFFRNVRGRDNLEIFLVAAISSLLLLRFLLYLTGYPQVGGGSLHIAHMLWGGLLMLAAITLTISFLGARVQRLSALLGGIGFGIFIDELGKFITRDNNYFFRPTIGLIYAIFIILFLIFNFLSRTARLTPREYELNALAQFEEAILNDLDTAEKAQIAKLLARADQSSPVTQELKVLLEKVEAIADEGPNIIQRILTAADRRYERFWRLRNSKRLVGLLFVAEAGIFLIITLGTVFNNFDNAGSLFQIQDSYTSRLIIGQLIASSVAAGFAIVGAFRIFDSRLEAFELFRRAVLINLLLTEFFIFSRIQFGAMPGFLLNLALLVTLRYAINEERRTHNHA
jgi:hypothetical protein